MESGHGWFGARLVDLAEAECWRLVESRPVGRLAYVDAGGPAVVPLNFVVVARAIRFRISAHGNLARWVPRTVAGFEVDDFDPQEATGWSVLVQGRVSLLEPELWPGRHDPSPWPAGVRQMLLELAAARVTGRRLMPR